jgi:hypothetical protein
MHGGGSRLPRIIEEISAYDPDVVAVTECRATPGVVLCAAMKERGLPNCETTNPSGTRNGIAVFLACPDPPEALLGTARKPGPVAGYRPPRVWIQRVYPSCNGGGLHGEVPL